MKGGVGRLRERRREAQGGKLFLSQDTGVSLYLCMYAPV